jgi:hypothetical protein
MLVSEAPPPIIASRNAPPCVPKTLRAENLLTLCITTMLIHAKRRGQSRNTFLMPQP